MKTTKLFMVPLAALIGLAMAGCSGNKKEDPTPEEPAKVAITVRGVNIAKALPNSTITLTGSNFSTDVNNIKVTFSGVAGHVYSATATQIVVDVPVNAPSGKITVTSNGSTATTPNDFTVLKGTQSIFAAGYFEHIAIDATGNIYGDGATTGTLSPAILKATPAGVVSVLAGGPSAPLPNVWGTAVDAAGNVYFADRVGRRIAKVSPAGVISTLAGGRPGGFGDGTGTAAGFDMPNGLAIDAAGNLYTCDGYRVRKITATGVVTTIAGTGEDGFTDGTATAAKVGISEGIAVDAGGNVYINDNKALRKITTAGQLVTVAGNGFTGFTDGFQKAAEFNQPQAMAIDAAGNIFIADNKFTSNSVVYSIRMVNKAGKVTTFLKNTYASETAVPYTVANGLIGATATTNFPNGIVFDTAGNMYICNTGARVVSKIAFN